MNFLRLSFLLVLLATVAACGDDDSSPTCTQAEWVGTYTGTIDCDGASEAVTVTITASGSDAIIVKYETVTIETETDPLTPNGCDLDRTGTTGGVTITVDATLDGDNLTYQDVITVGADVATCDITATRN